VTPPAPPAPPAPPDIVRAAYAGLTVPTWPNRGWYTEASAVLDLDGRPRPLLPEQQPAEVKVGADGFTR
jgi:hypothetical protein